MTKEGKGIRRLGMIGAGWVTAHHLPAWGRQEHRAQIVAIADPDLAAARRRAQEFNIPGVYASAEEMLESEMLDAVDICSPRETHAAMVRLAADKRLDIHCQKPLARTHGEAVALIRELPAGPRLMVHENWRFRAHYRRVSQWLSEGLAGAIRQVNLEFLSSGMIPAADGSRPALTRQPFFRTQERLLVMEVLIHHLDTLRFLLGELEVVSAWAERSNKDIVAEDVASITLRRRTDGVPVTVTASLAVHGAPPNPRDHLRIFGAEGTVELLGSILSIKGKTTRRQEFDPDATYQASYDAAIAHFLDCLDGNVEFETAPRDNLKTLELVEEVYRLAAFDPAAEPTA
jgi:predicted dehydrogenase